MSCPLGPRQQGLEARCRSGHRGPACASTLSGPRSRLLACFADVEEADGFRRAAEHCCNDTARGMRDPPVLRWPRAYVEAVLAVQAAVPTRPLDFNFIGGVSTDPKTSANRRWVTELATEIFTATSVYVDTTTGSLEGYEAMGPWDKTLERAGLAFQPKNLTKAGTGLCGRITCDVEYHRTLALSKFTLAPAGDAPWSMRFFEAAAACCSTSLHETDWPSPPHTSRTRSQAQGTVQ